VYSPAVYHAPRPVYQPRDILNHIEVYLDVLVGQSVIIAEDVNTLDSNEIISRCA